MTRPLFLFENGNSVEMPVFGDNLSVYRGAEPIFVRDLKVLAPQPHGNCLEAYQQVRQCQFGVGSSQCCRMTPIQPYCLEHAREVMKLEWKESNIKEAGDGLFAWNSKGSGLVFRKYEMIAPFHGEVLTWDQYRERYGAKYDKTDQNWFTPYAGLAGDKIIDALIVRGVMAMANDCREDWRSNVIEKYDQDEPPDVLKCYATQDIYHGDELYLSYGISWWIAFPGENGLKKY